MPTEQEKEDLAAEQVKVQKIKNDCFDYMQSLMRMDAIELRYSGHTSLGAALEYAIRSADRKINQIWKDHLKKYPDE